MSLAEFMASRYDPTMNIALKITRIGKSAGVVLPDDLLAHLDAGVGQTLAVIKTEHGIELRLPPPDLDTQLDAARDVMARRRQALRELAK